MAKRWKGLVAGASGVVGRRLSEYMHTLPEWDVVALSRNEPLGGSPVPRIAVDLTDDARRFWILVERGVASVHRRDPGVPTDVTIAASLPALFEVWLGRTLLADALADGTVGFHGPNALTDALPAALRLSPVAPLVRAAGPLSRDDGVGAALTGKGGPAW